MSKKNYVSVILPTYNRGNLIVSSIESVLKQTHKQLELIIVDDGSFDNTEEIVSAIKDDRIRYIRLEKNVGPAVARNIGVEHSNYELIAFEDSDDIWTLDKLEKQIPLINDEIGLVYCSYSLEYNTGKKLCIPSKEIKRKELSGNVYDLLCNRNVIGTPTILVKKNLFLQVKGFSEELRSLEDWDLVLKLAEITKVKHVDEILVNAYSSSNGVNHDYLNRVKCQFYMMERLKQKNKNIFSVLRYAIDDIFYLREKEEQENWKKKVRDTFFESNTEFDFIWNSCVLKNKFKMQNQILTKLCSEQVLNTYFQNVLDMDDNVGIYGLGNIGTVLLSKLREHSINIECIIDRNLLKYEDYKVVPIKEVGNAEISKIIITIPEEFDSIVREIHKYKKVECINIKQILDF